MLGKRERASPDGASADSASPDGASADGARGTALLDAAAAQRTVMVRSQGFASDADIRLLLSTPPEEPAGEEQHSTRYLQRGGLPEALRPLLARICAHVAAVDADHWGVLAELQLELV